MRLIQEASQHYAITLFETYIIKHDNDIHFVVHNASPKWIRVVFRGMLGHNVVISVVVGLWTCRKVWFCLKSTAVSFVSCCFNRVEDWEMKIFLLNHTRSCSKHYKRRSPSMTPCSGIHKMLYESVEAGYNATHNLITSSWDTWHALFPNQTTFFFPTSIVNHFLNKIVCAQPNMLCISYKFYARHHQKADFLKRISFVGRKRQARYRSVLSSYQVMVCDDSSHIR